MPSEGEEADRTADTRAVPGWRAWWGRLSTTAKAATAVVIGAGAVASALTAMGALLPGDPPPARVTFERPVHLNAVPVPMTEFRPGAAGVGPAMATTRPGGGVDVALLVSDTRPRAAAPVGDLESSPDGTEPSPSVTDSDTPSPSTSGEPEPEPEPAPESESESESGSTESPNPLGTRYVGSVASAMASAGWALARPEEDDDFVALFVRANATDPEGDVVAPEEAAASIVEKFEVTRSTTTTTGQRVPVGVVVSAAIRIQNAAGQPVRIDWALENADTSTERLSQEWLAGAPAVEVRAETSDDRGVLDLWVPLPEEAGTYVIKVTASRSRSSLPDDFVTTRPFR